MGTRFRTCRTRKEREGVGPDIARPRPRAGRQPDPGAAGLTPLPRGANPMKAVTWHGKRDVRVDDVPDPKIEQPTDAILRVTSSGICGSDLHLYETLGPFMSEGD